MTRVGHCGQPFFLLICSSYGADDILLPNIYEFFSYCVLRAYLNKVYTLLK
jgi:hypothetical protein